jgi:hypothetical protein
MMSTNEYFNILACCRTSFSKFVKVYGQIHKLRIFRVKTCPGRTSPTGQFFTMNSFQLVKSLFFLSSMSYIFFIFLPDSMARDKKTIAKRSATPTGESSAAG